MPKQALLNGEVEDGVDFTNYEPIDLLTDAISKNGWEISRHDPGLDGYHYMEIGYPGSEIIKLHAYVKKLVWRNRNEFEKAAQFGARHISIGRDIAASETEKALVFAIYKREIYDDHLICGWLLKEWGTKEHPFNCFIDIRAVAKAFPMGLVRDDSKNKLAVAFRPEFVHYFILNGHALLQQQPAIEIRPISPDESPRNKIIYGAPGTGKSHELREQARSITENVSRITFYPSYTYQQFVGTYKPTPIYKEVDAQQRLFDSSKVTRLVGDHHKEPLIDYTFVAGPFLKILVAAIKNPEERYLLIIEEINRANVSSVFGDVFQLLDRNREGDSEYSIEFNPDIKNFLLSQGIPTAGTRIPRNLFIWATMNSADQGVLPLDAAFKRRWTFQYLPLNAMEHHVEDYMINFQEKSMKWNLFRNTINTKLIQLGIPEDRLIGPFFLRPSEVTNDDAIKNKLLLYLRDDVVRHNPRALFNRITFSEIIEDYENGEDVFLELFKDEDASSASGIEVEPRAATPS